MESYVIGTTRLLGSLLRHHHKYRRWHYGLTLPESNPNSLASFLSLTTHQYNLLLTTLGLAILLGDGSTVRIKSTAWETFMIQEGLQDGYFDKMDVQKMPNELCTDGESCRYRGYWIGVGNNDLFKSKDGRHPNPSTQFISYLRPPRITNKRKYTLQIESAVKLIDDQRRISSSSATEIDSDLCDDYSNPLINNQDISQTKTIDLVSDAALNLNSFLNDYKYGKRSREETTKVIVACIVESIETSQQQRHKCLSNVINGIPSTKDDDDEVLQKNPKMKRYYLMSMRR